MKRSSFILVICIVLGAFLRLYNLNWGAPYFFHPDERNIASSISQLVFPSQMNPHFFAYGSLPLYLIFFTGIIFQKMHFLPSASNTTLLFENAIIVSRIFSAVFLILLIPLLYKIGKQILDEKTGLFAAIFASGSVGLIQHAHFGTVESWIAFFSALLLYLSLRMMKKQSMRELISYGLVIGILCAIKISSVIYLPFPFFVFIFSASFKKKSEKKELFKKLGKLLFIYTTAFFVFFSTSPFIILDTSSFLNSFHYESSVATGGLSVFYTQGFIQTQPVIYHIFYIFPFLVTPLFTLLFLVGIFFLLYKQVKIFHKELFLLLLFFVVPFLFQAILFVKWTRYMIPTLPFFYLILAAFLTSIAQNSYVRKIILIIMLANMFLYTYSYFLVVLAKPDSRITAAYWAKQHINSHTALLSEVYDLGILPFNNYFPTITLFNFYDLDTNSMLAQQLQLLKKDNTYIILPSQRIMHSRLTNYALFSKGNTFYTDLYFQKNGYKKIYETPCTVFCRILYMGNPIMHVEETAAVFDHPTVMIFKKL